MNINFLSIIIPEIVLSILFIGLVMFNVTSSRLSCKHRSIVIGVITLVMLACIFQQFYMFCGTVYPDANQFIIMDFLALFFRIWICFGCVCALFISIEDENIQSELPLYYALFIASCIGAMLLVSSKDFLTMLVALELMTIPLYILVGFKKDKVSIEVSMKFFILGAVSTALLLFGISLIYGVCGATDFETVSTMLQQNISLKNNYALSFIAIIFLFFGFMFKLALFPFHFWTPDVYQVAPTPVSAFLAVSRIATIVVLFRLFSQYPIFHFLDVLKVEIISIFSIVIILSLVLGNTLAILQSNLKRLFGYSSIAHSAFLLMAILGSLNAPDVGMIDFVGAGSVDDPDGLILYSVAYLLASIGFFASMQVIEKTRGSCDIESLNGLYQWNIPIAVVLLGLLSSLLGIPPLLGFLAKFQILIDLSQIKLFWVIGFGLLGTVIGSFYYVFILKRMFLKDCIDVLRGIKIKCFVSSSVAYLSLFLIVFFGLFPSCLLLWNRWGLVIFCIIFCNLFS